MEFPLRPVGNHGLSSSTSTDHGSSDKLLRLGDEYRQRRQTLEATLSNINNMSAGRPHSRNSTCETCIVKKHQIKHAFYEYYTHLSRHGVQNPEDINRSFSGPGSFNLSEVHENFLAQIRRYLANELCSQPSGEDIELTLRKRDGAQQLMNNDESLQDTLSSLLNWYSKSQDDRSAFTLKLQETQSAAQRISMYRDYYCGILPEDTPIQRNFKAKYAKIFESGAPYEDVVDAMQKEADQVNEEEVRALRHRLAELQMAQSAHLKNKRKKAERKDRRKIDREEVESKMAHCNLQGCENGINLESDKTIQCSLCDWLASKFEVRKRFYYCSVQHAQDDFDMHDRQAHMCFMYESQRCFYYPQPGPPGETEAGGICADCADHDIVSYFCSHECYSHNLEVHRDEFHYGRGIDNHADVLDIYRPALDLQIIA